MLAIFWLRTDKYWRFSFVLRYDYTTIVTISKTPFAMANPVAKPSWLSFYHPLSGQVWAAVLASTVIFCVALFMVSRSLQHFSQISIVYIYIVPE